MRTLRGLRSLSTDPRARITGAAGRLRRVGRHLTTGRIGPRRRGARLPPATTGPVLEIIRRRNRPVVVQTLRSAGSATVAYLAALWLSGNERPLLAPLTAILVVQVTLYATVTAGLRRVVSVIVGVLIAVLFAAFLGFSWWSLGILILACLTLGQLMRVQPFVPEVAISGMLVLGLGSVSATALGRVVETLIGAAVGVLVNLVFAPPVFVQPAGGAIAELADRLSRLLARIGRELREGATLAETTDWLQESRDLDQEIMRVDDELRRAEESLRLNPRAVRAPHTGMVLRSGLETLEHCAVTLRGLCRSLTDLSQEEGRSPSLYGTEIAFSLNGLLDRLADGVASFGRMLAAEVSEGGDRAESQLAEALTEARALREWIAELLRAETGRDPETWELHGALLANVDRLLNELDLEKRAEQRIAAMDSSGSHAMRATRTLLGELGMSLRAARRRASRRG